MTEGFQWGKVYLHPSAILKTGPFMIFQEIQSRLSGVILVTLAIFVFPVWMALLVMLFWGFSVTWLYELAREKGLPDLMETRQQGPRPISWIFNFTKTYSLGWAQYLYCKLTRRWLEDAKTFWLAKAGIYIIAAVVFGGMISVHHVLSVMGCRSRTIFWGNMLARMLALPGKWVQVSIWIWALYFVGNILGLGDLNDIRLQNIVRLREVM